MCRFCTSHLCQVKKELQYRSQSKERKQHQKPKATQNQNTKPPKEGSNLLRNSCGHVSRMRRGETGAMNSAKLSEQNGLRWMKYLQQHLKAQQTHRTLFRAPGTKQVEFKRLGGIEFKALTHAQNHSAHTTNPTRNSLHGDARKQRSSGNLCSNS